MGQSLSMQTVLGSVALFTLLWKLSGAYLHNYFTHKMTVVHDLPNLGKSRPDRSRISGTAVIVGGGIAGLWTARICADHFEDVLIIESEAWTTEENGTVILYDEEGKRKDGVSRSARHRVMQYDSLHAFQPIQLQALRRLLPEFEEEVKKSDGRILPHEYNMHVFGGHTMRAPLQKNGDTKNVDSFFFSREGYELLLRRLIRDRGRVRWLAGTATGLKPASDSSRIDSVLVRANSGGDEEIPASLIIDCSGPSQIGLKWLRRIYTNSLLPARPGSTPFNNLRLEYNTGQDYQIHRIFVPPAARSRLPIPGGYENAGFLYMMMPKPGMEKHYFIADRIEGHRIEFIFSGWAAPPLPKTIHDIKDYWLGIETDPPLPPWLFEMLDILLENDGLAGSILKPLGTYSWIRYENAPYIPSNFIAIGDAAMRANPVFGQGCSKAAIGAVTLDSLLQTPSCRDKGQLLPDFGYKFFKKQSDRISGVWDGVKPTDYQWDTTIPVEGEELSDADFMGGYANIILQLAVKDDAVNKALWTSRAFLAPPTVLFHPFIFAKVATFWLGKKMGFVV